MRSPELLSAVLCLGLQGCGAALPHYVRHSDPLTLDQHMQLGAAYEAQGLRDDAARQYDAASREGNVPALIARGNLAFQGGELKEAQKFYRRALKSDPDHGGANNNMAMVFLARGKLSQAEKFSEKALSRSDPLRPFFLDTLAAIRIKQRRFGEARDLLDQAEASAPAGPGPLREQLAKTRLGLETGP